MIRWRVAGVALAVLVVAGVVTGIVLAARNPSTSGSTSGAASTAKGGASGRRPSSDGVYLALGDSIAFGFRPPAARPTPDYRDPASLVGYPELVGRALGLQVVNASCPGETVASMISTTALSNGCESTLGKAGGYRTQYPLHVAYRGSQLAFAVSYLRTHHDVRLVTLGLGLNDTSACRKTTADKCRSAAERRAVYAEIGHGLAHIYHALQVTAGYRGRIVAVTYYNVTYPPVRDSLTPELDAVIVARAEAAGALVADANGAFARASAASHGSTCAAGLIVALRGGGCDKHPTAKGAATLAGAVLAALGH